MRDRWTRAELQGRQVYWLLDVAFAGQILRISDRPVSIPSDSGDVLYHPLLNDVRTTETMDLFSDSPSAPSASLEVVLPVDVPMLVMQGHSLGRAVAELSQVRDGDAWEDRRVILRGRLRDPEYGRAEDPIRFTLRQDLWDDVGVIPEPGAEAIEGPFPSLRTGTTEVSMLSDADIGVPYPIILGRPGCDPQNFRGWIAGSQAVWASKMRTYHSLILAGHRVEATQVWVNCDDNVYGQLFTVRHGFDARGREVAYISNEDTGSTTPLQYHDGLEQGGGNTVPAVYQPAVEDSVAVYVGWFSGGGAIGRDGTAIRGAGDVLEYLLQRTSVAVDHGRVAGAAPYLNRFLVDACIEARTSPMKWIQYHLLPILPMSLSVGPRGVYPIVWDPDAQAVAHLDADADPRIEIGERVRVDSSRILNDFELQYGLSLRTGEYQHSARLGARYEQELGYATGSIPSRNEEPDLIRLTAATAGPTGTVRVVVTDTGASPPTATDTAASNLVTVTYDSGTDTVDDIRTAINTGSSLVTADSNSTAVFSGVAWNHDITLAYEDRSKAADLACFVSQDRYQNEDGSGVFPESMASEVIYDRATADAVLRWRARAFALEHRTIDVLAPLSEWGWLQLGDFVEVTFTPLGLDAHRFFCEEREEANDGLVAYRLRRIEDLHRDARA